MRSYKVGTPFAAGRTRWREGAEYSYQDGWHQLRLFFSQPTPEETAAVDAEVVTFALVVEGDVILFLYRFGTEGDWSDAPYSWWMVRPERRGLPPTLGPGLGALLTTFLINADTGVLEALRVLTFSHEFSTILYDAIRAQASAPFDQGSYDAQLDALRDRYPTGESLLSRACVACIVPATTT